MGQICKINQLLKNHFRNHVCLKSTTYMQNFAFKYSIEFSTGSVLFAERGLPSGTEMVFIS